MPEKHNLDNNIELNRCSFGNNTIKDFNVEDKRQISKNIKLFNGEKSEKKAYLFLVFGGLLLALFLASLDKSIASILPHIGSEFNQMKSVSWIATAYLLPYVVFLPLFSKFSDIFGRKAIIMFGITTFLFGSLLCGVSTSLVMLIISRAIAGTGGGCISAMVSIIISDLIPLEKRGTFQSVTNSVYAMSSITGPLIFGSLSDYVTWRWGFYINLPIGALAIVILFLTLKLPVPQGNFKEKLKRIDYLGSLLVLASSTLFLLVMNFGGTLYPWKSVAVIVSLIVTVIFLIIFIYVETKVEEPLMPPRLFKKISVVCILITSWFHGMIFFSVIYYLPIYFQLVRGDSAMWSGIRLIPLQLTLNVCVCFSGVFISKKGIFKPLLPLGMAFLCIYVGLLSLFHENTSFSVIYGIFIIGGVGFAFMFSSINIALQASVERKDVAVVIGLGNFSRTLGGALGVAISSAILNSILSKELTKHLPDDIVRRILDSSEYVRNGCPSEYFEAVLACYIVALRMVWYIIVAMGCIGFLCSLNVKKAPILKVKEEVISDKKEMPFPPSSNSCSLDNDRNNVTVNMEASNNATGLYHT